MGGGPVQGKDIKRNLGGVEVAVEVAAEGGFFHGKDTRLNFALGFQGGTSLQGGER